MYAFDATNIIFWYRGMSFLAKDIKDLWWPNIHMSLEEALGKVLRVAYKLASEILTKKINAWSEIQRISMIFWSFGTPSYTLNTPILKY